jgi:LysM repeat protein
MLFGEGPTACPFVALESDRDRRADEPDHRHRCYAEPEPAPRALAHQRAYCLSPTFPGCPIFQDWAVRAAARPVPMADRAPDVTSDERPRPAHDWAAPPPWAGPVDSAAQEPEQLGAFDAGESDGGASDRGWDRGESDGDVGGDGTSSMPMADSAQGAPASSGLEPIERLPSLPVDRTGDAARDAEIEAQRQRRMLEEREQRAEEERRRRAEEERHERERQAAAAAVVPPFLADRLGPPDRDGSRERTGAQPSPPTRPQSRYVPDPRQHGQGQQAERSAAPPVGGRREDLVPVWEREPIRAYPTMGRRLGFGGSGDTLSTLTTLLAVLAVIALIAFVAIIVLPSMLAGGDGSGRPTAPVAGESPTLPGETARPPAPTPTEQPQPTPRTYRVAAGDTLFGIAQRFGLTVDQLLAANPQIVNADLVTIGQVINIPEPDFVVPGSPPATP